MISDKEEKLIGQEIAKMFLDMRALFFSLQAAVYCDNFEDRKYILENELKIYTYWKNKIVDEWDTELIKAALED